VTKQECAHQDLWYAWFSFTSLQFPASTGARYLCYEKWWNWN